MNPGSQRPSSPTVLTSDTVLWGAAPLLYLIGAVLLLAASLAITVWLSGQGASSALNAAQWALLDFALVLAAALCVYCAIRLRGVGRYLSRLDALRTRVVERPFPPAAVLAVAAPPELESPAQLPPLRLGYRWPVACLVPSFYVIFIASYVVPSAFSSDVFWRLGGVVGGLFLVLFVAGWLKMITDQRLRMTDRGISVPGYTGTFIRWDEIKLFAVVRDGREPEGTAYELSGPYAMVRWPGFVPHRWLKRFTVPRLPREEYERRLAEHLAYIHAKTGLPLVDLNILEQMSLPAAPESMQR